MRDPVSRIAYFAPTPAEYRDPFRLLQVRPPIETGRISAAGSLHGVEVVLVRTGMGRENAAAAAAKIFDTFSISEVLVAGFAGALRSDLKVADAVVCSEVWESIDNSRVEPSKVLVQRAQRTGRIGCTAPAVTVDHVVRSAAGKRALNEACGAAVVEMEGFPLLAESLRRGIPGLMVRAILDPSNEDLPDVTHLLSETGELRVGAWVRYVMMRPGTLAFFCRMARRIKACRSSMNRFIERYFALYREEGVQ